MPGDRGEKNPARDGFFKSKFGGSKNNYKVESGRTEKPFKSKMHRVDKGRVEKPQKNESKPFDKKTYRLKKYSNKYKLDKWENQRRKEVLKKYYKDIKNDPTAGKYTPFDFDKSGGIKSDSDEEDDNKITPKEESTEENKIHYVLRPDLLEKAKRKQKVGGGKVHPKQEERLDKKGKIQPFWKVKQEMQRLKEEKMVMKEAQVTAAKEREEAIAKYKQKKADKFKKLSKKTKTGQPLMKDRMQMLLESIQKSN